MKYKGIFIWLAVILVSLLLFRFVLEYNKAIVKIDYTTFKNQLDINNIEEVKFREKNIEGKFNSSFNHEGNNYDYFTTSIPFEDTELVRQIEKKNVRIVAEKPGDLLTKFAIYILPLVLIGILFFYMMRQVQVSGSKAMSFGKSNPKISTQKKHKVTFEDVAGCEEAKEELMEVIEFLKNPKKFTKLGGRIPKGVLLVGQPGTGKTLLAKAISGEANVPFLNISGSEFVELFVGVGASRVRDLFNQGKKNAPCIIFIDEIDAVGRQRGAGLGGGHDEREQTLNQLLVEMDGFESNEGVILIAASNRPDVLDPALLRPGRFDRRIVIPLPDVKGREGILRVHTKNIPVAKDVKLSIIARGTPGMSGADLANLVNEAALLAARNDRNEVTLSDFEEAKDKVLMGIERKSMIISDEERKIIAYHEAGHAIAAKLVKNADPIHKVTIIPRGFALGLTQQLPLKDKYNYSKEYLIDQIKVLLGGRASEEIFLKTETTGAANDLENVTNIARKMVCEWGMSEKLGPVTFGIKEEEIFLGRQFGVRKDFSEKTSQIIDEEVKQIVMQQYNAIKELITKNSKYLESIAENLLKYEVLDGKDIDLILQGKKLRKVSPAIKKKKDIQRRKQDAEEKVRVKVKEKKINPALGGQKA
jgi:cell division protease FtsH